MRSTIKFGEKIRSKINEETYHVHRAERFMVKIPVSNLIQCNAPKSFVFVIKIQPSYFMDMNTLILTYEWRSRRPRIANSLFHESNKITTLTLSNFKITVTSLLR